VTALGIIIFVLCNLAVLLLNKGVVDELDFWGGTFALVLFGTIEAILFSWVFGMDKAWEEMHTGADIRLPRIYRFIIRYVTPVFLLCILVFWGFQEAKNVFLMKTVPPENVPYVVGTRVVLLLMLAALVWLVSRAWKRRESRKYAGGKGDAP